METWEVLEQALERLGPKGENWVQGTFGWLTPGPYCMAGALNPLAETWGTSAPYDAVVAAIGVSNLSSWNDHPDRTFSEVRAAFQAAIRSEKAKAGVLLDADLGGGNEGVPPEGTAAELSAESEAVT